MRPQKGESERPTRQALPEPEEIFSIASPAIFLTAENVKKQRKFS
jgi:hypothetical protein